MAATITAEGLGKRYLLGTGVEGTLAEASEARLRAPLRRLFRRPEAHQDPREEIWALRDVSFELEAGEALGMVGANGAGKSTLLKLLSRITDPTEGRLTIQG